MLTVNSISYAVKDKLILENVKFEVLPGEHLAIIGPNGAGKSTLLKALAGEILPVSGKLHWEEKNLSTWAPQKAARSRAVLHQDNTVSWNFTVEEVVMMGRFPYHQGRIRSEDQRHVGKWINELSLGNLNKRSYATLSGGEKQRVHIARIMAQLSDEMLESYPKLALLDEPLNNLDIRHQHKLLEMIRQFAEKRNVVATVLHDLNLAAQYADKIALLKSGKLLAFGTVEDVLTEENLSLAFECKARIARQPVTGELYIMFGIENTINQKYNQQNNGSKNEYKYAFS